MSLNSFRVGLDQVMKNWVGKTLLVIIAALLVFSFVYSGMPGGRGGAAAANGADETIGTVNGVPITRADFDQALSSVRQQAQMQAQMFGQPATFGPLQSGALHQEALDQLTEAKLRLAYAKKIGLKVTDDDIAKQRMQIATQANLPEKLGLKPGASLTDIDAAFAKLGQPRLEDRLPDDVVREYALQDKLDTYLKNKVVVSEQDARDSYTQYHTRHILIDNKKRSDVQAEQQANQILAKAKAPGADFAALAKQYSEDPGTKNKGGDDGWIDQNTGYVPEFKTAAFALKPGEVTLVKSPQFGYFIIKLEATRPNLPKDFEKNKAQYITQVQQQKQQKAQQDFMDSLKNDPANKIVITDPQLRADHEASEAAKESDPAKQQQLFQSALADYQKALAAKPTLSAQGEINAQMAQIYQQQKQTGPAIAALQAAVAAQDDPNLRMALGSLLLQNKQPKEAAEQLQAASKQAWDNPTLHNQLLGLYLQMKRPDLVAQEREWITKYQAQQKRQQASMPFAGGPGGMPAAPGGAGAPVSITPNGPIKVTTSPSDGGVKVTTTPSNGEGTPPVKPASGKPAPSGPKPPQ